VLLSLSVSIIRSIVFNPKIKNILLEFKFVKLLGRLVDITPLDLFVNGNVTVAEGTRGIQPYKLQAVEAHQHVVQ